MAVRSGLSVALLDGAMKVSWSGLLQSSADTGTGELIGGFRDKTVQIAGTFGAGGAVTIQGSNDGTNWATLNDDQGVALVITTTVPRVIAQNPIYIRPSVTAGDGTTNLACTVFGNR